MKAWLLIAVVLTGILLAACGTPEMIPPLPPTQIARTSTGLVVSSPQPMKTTQPTARPSQPPTATAGKAVTATKTANNGTSIVLTSGSLTVRIDSPADGATVTTSPVEVKGQAPAGTVVSIDDTVLVVKADKVFSVKVGLKEGPNLVEVVASDQSGNQVHYELAIYFEP